ncbi:MAG: hypothetical protein Q9187_002211 [Circinaria calcarea]
MGCSDEKTRDSGGEKQLANGASGHSPDYLVEARTLSLVPGSDNSPLGILQHVHLHNPHHPIHWPSWKKWYIVSVYCFLQILVTITSTSYVSAKTLIQERFGGSIQGTAKALNLPMLIIFQFLSGVAGSTALTNVAGTIADLFGNADNAGQAMALFVWSANIGAGFGGPIGEWIVENPKLGLPWIFWINSIIGAGFAVFMCLIPETLPRIVTTKIARREDSISSEEAAIIETKVDVVKELQFVATMALKIMVTEPIVAFLGIYNGFAYGLLFLYLEGVFSVFAVNNGLSYIDAVLTYLNVAVGVTVMFLFVPVQTYLFKRDRLHRGGKSRPEARFLTSMVAVWLFPISLFWFAFTSNGKTSFWSPVVAGGVLGFANPLLWLSMLNYITGEINSYPNVAASAVAAFSIPSFVLAAAFAHIGMLHAALGIDLASL